MRQGVQVLGAHDMTLTPDQLAHLEAESREDGATMIHTAELRELVAAYQRLREIERTWGVSHDFSDVAPEDMPRF